MEAMRIVYNELPTTECEKDFSNVDIYFDLEEKFIKWHSRYNAYTSIIDNDPSSGFQEVLRSWDVICKREHISGVEKVFYYGSKWWKINIEFKGVTDKMYITVPKRKESVANKFYGIFSSYIQGATMDELEKLYNE